MITTTLNRIKAHDPCADGWRKLLASLPKKYDRDAPIAITHIVDSNGLNDALWALRTLPEHNSLWRHFAIDCVERVKHLLTDERSLKALEVARCHANGEVTDNELTAARDAAWAATWDAARAAARAAARDAAWAAAWDAARTAAWAAARDAARVATWDAARDAARTVETTWQAERLSELCEAGEYRPMTAEVTK